MQRLPLRRKFRAHRRERSELNLGAVEMLTAAGAADGAPDPLPDDSAALGLDGLVGAARDREVSECRRLAL